MVSFFITTQAFPLKSQFFSLPRPDIYSLTQSQQDTLHQLMLDYIDSVVVSTHANNTPMVHGNSNFLPFHREYVAGMEDYLILRGYPEYVPLPKWDPVDSVPLFLQKIDSSACINAQGPGNCAPLENVNASIVRDIFYPAWHINSNLCYYTSTEHLRIGDVNYFGIEAPWHNTIHFSYDSTNGLNGAMRGLRSPSALVFWNWHAYVDEIWKTWECACNNLQSVDLWMRDTPMKLGMTSTTMHTMSMDRGIEPNTESVPSYMWISEDIWIRNQPDGFTTDIHQDPEYSSTNPVYVYVRVRNRGCNPSLGNENLVLYWSKAATALAWPSHWNGSLTIGGSTGPSAGEPIDTLLIPSIKAGGSTIVEFEWFPPDTADYSGINPEPWHFCLLARIEANNDTMTYPETSDLNGNVTNNNNIVWKNITIVDKAPGIISDDILPGGVIAIGNVFEYSETFDFEFLSLDFEEGEVYEEAEVLLTLDETSWGKWIEGNQMAENIDIFSEDKRQLIVTANNAWLKNLTFDENERSTMHVSFNFLTEEVTEHPEFDYHVVQRRAGDQKIIGGEKYQIIKPSSDGELFFADGGENKNLSKEDSVQLSASDIGKPAIYKWYNSKGKLIHVGKDFTVTPEITEVYKLEVIAEKDGYKDYDKVTVHVKLYEINSISPNPANNNVIVKYDSENATSAFLQLVLPFGNTYNQYILDVQSDEITIDVSGYQTGIYNIVLIVDGQAVDSQNLIIQ